MRMHIRRFTRLTNAFSKKFENHAHMVAIALLGTIRCASTRRFADARDGRRPVQDRLMTSGPSSYRDDERRSAEAGTARTLSKESFLMAIYAQILSAIFALMAAALWLGAAFVRTPRSFSVQVITWHTHNSDRVDGSETAGGGHGTSDELVALAACRT